MVEPEVRTPRRRTSPRRRIVSQYKDDSTLDSVRHVDIENAKVLFRLAEQRKQNEHQRDIERKKSVVAIWRESLVTLFLLILVGVLLYYAGQRILDPAASQDEKKLAFGIWGTAIGAASAYLFSRRPSAE